jgi:hypothetical protein
MASVVCRAQIICCYLLYCYYLAQAGGGVKLVLLVVPVCQAFALARKGVLCACDRVRGVFKRRFLPLCGMLSAVRVLSL